MQKSDDGTMAIVQMVAADHHAFDSILADTRPEIRVFEIGKTDPATIQAEMQKYKQDTSVRLQVEQIQLVGNCFGFFLGTDTAKGV